jgi:hypothetical protein
MVLEKKSDNTGSISHTFLTDNKTKVLNATQAISGNSWCSGLLGLTKGKFHHQLSEDSTYGADRTPLYVAGWYSHKKILIIWNSQMILNHSDILKDALSLRFMEIRLRNGVVLLPLKKEKEKEQRLNTMVFMGVRTKQEVKMAGSNRFAY